MEGNTEQTNNQPISFSSENIAQTKSKEKKEVFVAPPKPTIAEKARKKLPIKKIILIAIPVIIIAVAALNYRAILKLFMPSFESAFETIKTDREKGLAAFQKRIDLAVDPEEKSDNYTQRARVLLYICKIECETQIRSDAEAAEKLYPSANSAYLKSAVENNYGSTKEMERWSDISFSRGDISWWWDESLYGSPDIKGINEDAEEEVLENEE